MIRIHINFVTEFFIEHEIMIKNCIESFFIDFCEKNSNAYISVHSFSIAISTAFITSPAERYISAAALGSLTFFAHSAFFRINDFLSTLLSDFTNSYSSIKNNTGTHNKYGNA